jgi:hypothetical protein
LGKVAGEEVVVDGDVLQADGFAKGLNPPRITVTHSCHTHSCHTHTAVTYTHTAVTHTHSCHTHTAVTYTAVTHTAVTHTQLSHTHSCHTHTAVTHTAVTHTQLSHTGQAQVMRGGWFESIDASTAAAAGAATPEPKDNRPRHYGKKTKQHEGLTRNMVRV